MCFQIAGKSDHSYKCVKSRIFTKVIYYFLSVDTFEQQCAVIEVMIKSPCLQYHMKCTMLDDVAR